MDVKAALKKPAVFLDRDGVLTVEKSYVCSVAEIEIFPYTKECIKQIKDKGYYAIVITNQSGVARGLFTEDTLVKMNEYLLQETGVDALYYCPHYWNGTIPEYTFECDCRKPKIGMIQKACNDFLIDLGHSYMVGDRATDILLGQNVGVKTVLVESGYGTERLEADVRPDYVMEDLREVIDLL